ncbi:hypothetical protein NP233_g8190 [Leucocoprinus birnbaumii]|uniref:Nephrocystin 3-like N-terminal domain-containing protein n=1 Tax=Leucocoprinus birnbaumii TaxID=56174 RepID=A0AAD5VMQ3_9AGAR|nr:hypothetical protein NP233_g8190 [Leucocoprinus birnbaumii]
MPALEGAHNFVIHNPTIYNTESHSHTSNGHVSDGIAIIYEASTPEAAVDAKERSYAPSCYPSTREQYIEDITNWAMATDSDDVMPLFWMKGPAGVGKSAIAQTCAEKLKESGHLAAAFFFSVSGRRSDHTRFFPTLAHQLAALLPDYREVVTGRVAIDRTLVDKTMSAQYKSLIVAPLQELKEKGREVQQRTIIIDGLDECASKTAQVEIIDIIASSIRAGFTPFRWAFFSREEAHIIDAFKAPLVSTLTQSVFLPISREADKEIETYLRGGFINILRRRDFLDLASSWPSDEDIRNLVEAAAGLFAHPATVIRFIDNHPSSDFKEILKAVLISIANPNSQLASPYAELDSLYMLILRRVPEDLVPSVQLLLSDMAIEGFDGSSWRVATICNALGISEFIFRRICQHLRPVITFQTPPPDSLNDLPDPTHSFYGPGMSYNDDSALKYTLFNVHGTLNFHHKSFFDFLIDPSRSSDFCVTAPAIRNRVFESRIQQQFRFASSYTIQGGSALVSREDNSSSLLAWPQGSEFVDSFLKLWAFSFHSFRLVPDHPYFYQLFETVSSSLLRKLAQVDYRKGLISRVMVNGLGLWTGASVAGCFRAGVCRYTEGSEFKCINKDNYDRFSSSAFYRMIKKLEIAGVIRPWHPQLGSSRASSLLRDFSSRKSQSKNSGLYKYGHGDKSVIWYWEFDTKERYFHGFQTVNFKEAMAYYKADKFTMWDWDDSDVDTGDDGNDDKSDRDDKEEDKAEDGDTSDDRNRVEGKDRPNYQLEVVNGDNGKEGETCMSSGQNEPRNASTVGIEDGIADGADEGACSDDGDDTAMAENAFREGTEFEGKASRNHPDED